MGLITMGDWSYGSIKVIGQFGGKVRIGKFTSIADGVQVITVGHNPSNVSTFPFMHKRFVDNFPKARGIETHPVKYGNTEIGNDVWIGQNVTIVGGISVQDGAVLAANCVVTREVPAYAVVAGNPARIIRYRFEETVIQQLREIRWWDWPINQIMEVADLLCCDDVHLFIQKAREIAR